VGEHDGEAMIRLRWQTKAERANARHFGAARPPFKLEDLGEETKDYITNYIIKCTNAKGFYVKVAFNPIFNSKPSKVIEEGYGT
jgi:hypothetical protein